jgi:biotin-(acetyl-CoA carboxylase) ligase
LEVILKALVLSLVGYYQVLQKPDGSEVIACEWSKRSSYSEGRQIRVSCGDESFEGITRGLQNDGALRVETSAGEIKKVRAGDVTAVRSFSL